MKTDESRIELYRKRLHFYNITRLSEKLGIPYRTLNDFANGKTKRPNAEMYEKLRLHFEE